MFCPLFCNFFITSCCAMWDTPWNGHVY
jgi:hypothetical protein